MAALSGGQSKALIVRGTTAGFTVVAMVARANATRVAMLAFKVKRVPTSLFGVIEAANQDSWLGSFSGSAATANVEVDDGALDLIAEELEPDAEGLTADAERYVGGLYRAKARGMGGSRLGDFGEVIAFLLKRSSGSKIV